MTDCQSCTAPADLFLCPRCIDELSDMLTALVTGGTTTDTTQQGTTASGGVWRIERDRHIPGLLADLADAATGQTRFAATARRSPSQQQELHGDMTIDEARKIVNKLLAAGRVNVRASQLIRDIRKLLREWTENLAQHAGQYQPLDPNDLTGYAQWLNHHTHQLAGINTIGQLHHQLRALTRRAHKCVDRPPNPRFCGQCDTMIDRRMCGVNLYAHRDAIETTCPNCHTTHNIERLFNRTLTASDHRTFTRDELVGKKHADPTLCTTGIMGAIDEHISPSTFNRWTREGHLKPVQYLRPNGRHGFHRRSPDDTPKYRLSDVRNIKRRMAENEKSGKAKTK